MNPLVILFGALIFALGAWGTASPERLIAWLGRLLEWWTSRPSGFIRAWCALALGGALVFAGT